MIGSVDSSYAIPSVAQAQQASAAGVKVWSGYLATRSGVRIARPWTQQEFNQARACGGTPIAFCSGFDDPVACKNLAAAWNVRLCLDVEATIRGNGAWVQAWLDQSGAGLYGNAPVFAGRRAPFYILAAYPGSDPGTTWPRYMARPNGPLGWQWIGTHNEFGASVDRSWLDDWFLTGGDRLSFPISVRRAWVRKTYMQCLGREPESEDRLAGWASAYAEDGSNWEGLDEQIATSPEGLAYRAKLAALVAGGQQITPTPQVMVDSKVRQALSDLGKEFTNG